LITASRGGEATPVLDASAGVAIGMTGHLHLTHVMGIENYLTNQTQGAAG
jgi:hypothetical protein